MRARAAVIAALVIGGLAIGFAGQPPSTAPTLHNPAGLALASDGTLYISDSASHQVLKLTRGRLELVAGTGESGFSGDGGPALRARFFAPGGLALDVDGVLIVADSYNHRIRRIDRSGVITTIAGTGTAALSGDDGSA